MTDPEIEQRFMSLAQEVDDSLQFLFDHRPFLAHYTSIDILEKILKDGELWFSNPLYMNDLEEMRFGVNRGRQIFDESKEVADACGSPERLRAVKHYFQHYFNEFEEKHALDTYVLCLSEHDPKNDDGMLSMWRGYGRNGNGAALVFSTGFVLSQPSSPLLITRVHYGSEAVRLAWIREKLGFWCDKLKEAAVPDDKLWIPTYQLFNLVKMFALIFKHDGFHEEKEWRIIYMPDRDRKGLLKDRYSYIIGGRGVEPKLKFPIEPLEIEPVATWKFSDIVEQIILGPSLNSVLSRVSFARMLEKIGRPEFSSKVVSSSIPLRPS